MLFGLEILVAAYIGIRLYDKINEKTQTSGTDPQALTTTDRTAQDLALYSPAPPTDAEKAPVNASKHYLKASSLAVAFSLVGLWYPIFALVGAVALSYTTVPIIRKTEQNLRTPNTKKINNDLLNSIITVACITTGNYLMGSVMIWFMHLGGLLVNSIQDNTKKLLTEAFDAPPQKVWLVENGVEYEIPLENVRIGDTLVINTGEIIAVDGIISDGMAMIDQHTLTGESAPVEKITGDEVFASTLIVSGKILIQVVKQGNDTAIAQVMQVLLNTTNFKMSLQTKGEQWADKMAMPLLLLGGGLLPIIGIMPAMTVLYSGPGNMIATFVSLQLLSHMSLFSQHGILVKDGRTLEIIPKVDTILFDKTGTLTEKMPEVGKIFTFTEYDAATLLRYAAIAEQRLAHPIAHAILHKAEQEGVFDETVPLETADYQVGYGITVVVENQTIQVGSLRFMALHNIDVSAEVTTIQQTLLDKGSSLIAIGINGTLAGVLEITAPLRPEIENTMHDLRQRGISYLAIVSGDHAQPTQRLATQLNMDAYYHDVLPQDKADIVKKLQAEGRTVCFIGDGVNDAIAIKQADVSISLNGATTVATDLAQVVLMDDDLSKLPVLLDISQQLRQRSIQSLAISCTYGLTTFTAGALFRMGLLFPMTVGTANYMAGLAHGALPLLEAPKER